jgi:hypothetical protein
MTPTPPWLICITRHSHTMSDDHVDPLSNTLLNDFVAEDEILDDLVSEVM